MNWDACLVEGQQQGYLKSYTKSTSLKAAYLRWKKKKYKIDISNQKKKKKINVALSLNVCVWGLGIGQHLLM